MNLIKVVKKAKGGQIIEVWSNDEGSKKDIPKWAEKARMAEFIAMIEDEGYRRYQVKKIPRSK